MSDLDTAAPEVPAPDAPEAPSAEAVDIDPAEIPADLTLDETPVTETETAPAGDDPFAAYGGKDIVEQAIRLHEASKTDDGVIQLFIEAGRSLGLSMQQIQGLFQATAPGAPAAPAEEDPDLDEPITKREWQEMTRKQQEEHLAKEQARDFDNRKAAAAAAIQDTFKDLGVDAQGPDADAILRMGDRYLDKANLSPEGVKEAVRRGHADFQALVEKKAKEYLVKKRDAGQSVPSAPVGASAPSTPPPAEPANAAEAIKLARKALGI